MADKNSLDAKLIKLAKSIPRDVDGHVVLAYLAPKLTSIVEEHAPELSSHQTASFSSVISFFIIRDFTSAKSWFLLLSNYDLNQIIRTFGQLVIGQAFVAEKKKRSGEIHEWHINSKGTLVVQKTPERLFTTSGSSK